MSDEAQDVVGVYNRHAKAWTEARGARLPEKGWLDRFLGLLPAAGAVLDLGCGSGVPIARYLVAQGRTVTGVDAAPEMILLFRRNLPDQQACVADMLTMQPRGAFDGILAWDSFFHLSHAAQREMLSRFRLHARPRAALMFTSGSSFGTAIGSLDGDALYHASLDTDEYRHLLAENGFEVLAQVNDDPGCGGRAVWLAQRG